MAGEVQAAPKINCFGLCLTTEQQVLFWLLVGSATLAVAFFQYYQAQAKLKPRTKVQPGKASEGVTASLLENGQSPGEDISKPIRASTVEMNRVCAAHVNGDLESAGLAVLCILAGRRQHNSPSLGVVSKVGPVIADVELADGPMTFLSLLKASQNALSAARSQQSASETPEVILAWGSPATAPGQWSLVKEGEALVVTGSSRDEEKCFQMLFESCAANPEGDIWQMPMYAGHVMKQAQSWGAALKDFKQYRDPSNQRIVPMPKLLAAKQVNLQAEAVAGEDFSYSYEVLRQSVNAVAEVVKQKMAGKESKFVVLFMGRGKMLAPSFLGILQAGFAVVPIDVHWPGDRAKGVATDSGSGLVLTDPQSAQTWADIASELPSVMIDDGLLQEHSTAACSLPTVDQEDPAVLLFTSGSTGKPKGIILSHGYLTALVAGVGETKEMNTETRTLSYHSPTWMPFLDYLLAPLLNGGCCLFYPEVTSHVVRPTELNAFARQKEATLLGLVPAVLDIFLEAGLPPTLSTVGVGGAAVTAELCLRVAAAQESRNGKPWLLTTGYSGTEQGDVTNIRMRSIQDVEDAAGVKPVMGAGRPHAGQTYAIVDRGGSIVGPGAVGEVMVTGPGLATGYLNLEQQTAEYFIPCKALGASRAAKTGDLARWTETGSLELVGRLGSMVKVRGARIDLGEVEVAIGSHPNVKACVVSVFEDKLVAYVEPAVPGDLRDMCKDKLVAYMIPHVFEGLEEIPRLANGKFNKKALKPPAPREDGEETVMELDSLGQMRKFSRKNAAEDVVLDNVRAILIGVVIMSHAIPMHEGQLQMIDAGFAPLNASWAPWQYWVIYLLRSGGWSSLAFLSGYDDTRAEHKGYGLTYREVLFMVVWVVCGFNWTMWYLPAFVYMRVAFVAWAKMGLEKTHILLASQLWITVPAFVDFYVGWQPPLPGQETVCSCTFCPFDTFSWAETASYYLFGYWNSGVVNSYLGHGLIFVPCYWIGLYSGKHIFPLLCSLSDEKSWSRRVVVAMAVVALYLAMFTQLDAVKNAYDDQCSSFWSNNGSFLWMQVLKNLRYFALNLSMSLLYVIVIAALVPVHLKYLAKICFSSLLFSPFVTCLLDLPHQALLFREQLPSLVSPVFEMAWITAIPFLFELVCGAAFSVILPVVFKGVMGVWNKVVQ
mmetsp:Transcript_89004/g.157611  ORF Transcript_89004/g.157611 Transcript_89004/m.157611 type:complete len:1166 (-) Transcript_89004:295-3792(-)|eukprot:CAMPEP_0197665296 /NCGR_PEP_ID=MMETSP1338-20131121/59141_1 /TAXON_ID=43686 ORGANISM="Pelagodinium beii, Strain RCC1491" /NCGR_SAMPLE_ID=MMETSP1338 /ASSEMBLY_ACC=CAM_ASM_000754 /LENGTH=1165 /DNA_ID=CAMNT_0043244075 /DNA_START=45 /DNA_END=3542 /DNA_ORIENTATION=+